MELTTLYIPVGILLDSLNAVELGKAGAVKSGQGVCLKVVSHGPASNSADN